VSNVETTMVAADVDIRAKCDAALKHVERATDNAWESAGNAPNSVVLKTLEELTLLDHPTVQALGLSKNSPPYAYRVMMEDPQGHCTKELFLNKFLVEVKLIEMFMCADSDHDGKLSAKEFHVMWSGFPELSVIIRRVITAQFPTFDPDHLDMADFIFKKLEKDGDNMISRDELMQVFDSHLRVRQIFQKIDKNNDEIISLTELECAMKEDQEVKMYFESVVSDDFAMVAYDPELMFKNLHETTNGGVSFTEFVDGIRSFAPM